MKPPAPKPNPKSQVPADVEVIAHKAGKKVSWTDPVEHNGMLAKLEEMQKQVEAQRMQLQAQAQLSFMARTQAQHIQTSLLQGNAQ